MAESERSRIARADEIAAALSPERRALVVELIANEELADFAATLRRLDSIHESLSPAGKARLVRQIDSIDEPAAEAQP